MLEAEKLTCSQRRYLLAVYQLYLQKVPVTITEVAQMVGVGKSSATCMMGKLSEKGFLRKAYYGEIELTENGIDTAELIYDRVQVLHSFFTEQLMVDTQQAQTDAVAIVVYSSELTVKSLTNFIRKNSKCPEAG